MLVAAGGGTRHFPPLLPHTSLSCGIVVHVVIGFQLHLVDTEICCSVSYGFGKVGGEDPKEAESQVDSMEPLRLSQNTSTGWS